MGALITPAADYDNFSITPPCWLHRRYPSPDLIIATLTQCHVVCDPLWRHVPVPSVAEVTWPACESFSSGVNVVENARRGVYLAADIQAMAAGSSRRVHTP